MQPSRMIRTFTDKYPFVGPIFWMVSIQYYIIQVVVATAWMVHYSLTQNTISDLGNTACGSYGGRFVCSPLHSLMNASFITLGFTMIFGATLIYQEFKETRGSLTGFVFMSAAGLGTLIVGLFPENSINILHIMGAALPFLVGNIGLVILGSVLDMPRSVRTYTLISGVISLIALIFFIFHIYFGLGIGGTERLVAYPQTMWLIVFGIYISSNHIKSQNN